MADESDALFREIEEDLRQDQAHKLWADYGKYFVAAAVALIIAVGGIQGWKTYDINTRQAAGEAFSSAQKYVADKNTEEALKAFSAIADEGSGYALLAQFRKAALIGEAGDLTAAASIYQKLANDDGIAAYYRDMAVILGAMVELDNNDANGVLIGRVGALNNAKNAWRHSAREILGLSALKNGDNSKASEFFRSSADDATAPAAIKARASEMLTIIGE